nr:f-box protein [Quercus suber]
MEINANLIGCSVNGELLIEQTSHSGVHIISFDSESLNEENLGIPQTRDVIYTADFGESLVLLNGADIKNQSLPSSAVCNYFAFHQIMFNGNEIPTGHPIKWLHFIGHPGLPNRAPANEVTAFSRDYKFILSFDVDDERFREIRLPQNYLAGVSLRNEWLAILKGSLALIVIGDDQTDSSGVCHIWVMTEYGVAKSWTKKSVPMDKHVKFLSCTINGELLIRRYDLKVRIVSFDPESLKEEVLRIPDPRDVIYTTNFVESLVLLDGLSSESYSLG